MGVLLGTVVSRKFILTMSTFGKELEMKGLIPPQNTEDRPSAPNRNSFNKIILILGFGTFSLVGLSILFRSNDDFSKDQASKAARGQSSGLLPHLICPVETDIAPSLNEVDDESISEFYENKNIGINNKKLASLTLEDVEKLKNKAYDGWERSYPVVKGEKRDWKKRMFKSLKPGDTIFESACGRGFNLLMTAEVLKEEYGIDGLNMYGIEYVQSSADVANHVLDLTLPPLGSSLGVVCRADATNLSFIEDESFDLAFTGYIDPLFDALDLASELGHDLETEDICGKSLWAKKKLQKLDQKAQEDWYSAWVVELIRIAKKGSPVIVEEVSLPMCDEPGDWGGVSRDWWGKAVATYGWDVDVDSIVFGDGKGGSAGRYNVFMRKKK